jgi:hypothetical protein
LPPAGRSTSTYRHRSQQTTDKEVRAFRRHDHQSDRPQ